MTQNKPTILVIDDAPENLFLVKEVLKFNYRVLAVTSGIKALELIHKKVPDLILLDVMMPKMSGYEVCQVLKSSADTAAIPVLFLSAKTDFEDEAYGLSLGAADFINKPLNPDLLLCRVKTHLALKNALEELEQCKN